MRRRQARSVRRWMAAGALPLAVVAGLLGSGAAAAPAVAGHRAAGWSGLWQGTGDGAGGTTLAAVRDTIGAGSGTAATLTGAGVGVALIDTGVAPVPGLPADRIVNGPDLSFESQSDELRYLDTFGHGTHMAGIVVGDDPATGTRGLAPGAKLTSLKLGTANGAVDVTQVLAAIDWVVQHRNDDPAYPIRVLNLSYGTGGASDWGDDTLQFAVEQAWWAGITVVAAAGNDASTAELTNPASDPFVIAVGAASTKGTASPLDDDVAAFSNRSLYNRNVDLLAPGESVLSLRDPGSSIDETYPGARVGETLFRGSGTSQAAAVTSAAVALLLQARPTLTPDQVKKILVRSGTALQVGTALKLGLRELNLGAALTRATPSYSGQDFYESWGVDGVELSRGSNHVVRDGVALRGERSIFGPFDCDAWTSASGYRRAWRAGAWMGYRMAGDGWTGTSFASRTWGSAAWPGTPWSGATSWVDPDWTGRYWAGRYWAGRYWAGSYWASDDWSTARWS